MLLGSYVAVCCPIHHPLVGSAACCCIGICNAYHCIAVLLLILLTFCWFLSAAGQLVTCESSDRSHGVRCPQPPTAAAAAITKALVAKVTPPLAVGALHVLDLTVLA